MSETSGWWEERVGRQLELNQVSLASFSLGALDPYRMKKRFLPTQPIHYLQEAVNVSYYKKNKLYFNVDSTYKTTLERVRGREFAVWAWGTQNSQIVSIRRSDHIRLNGCSFLFCSTAYLPRSVVFFCEATQSRLQPRSARVRNIEQP